ncbi:MAG: hypothetical protein FIB02_10735 [Desulfuromonas sp.]|nr:hypothetical protein [Desulfuromonas sp.]
MKPDCLNERDLILLHYGECPDGATPAAAADHLAACAACRARQEQLALELARIPAAVDPEPAVATRIAARVNERLGRRSALRWLPVLGGAAVAAAALIITFAVRSPQPELVQIQPPTTANSTAMNLEEDLPDIDFLEDLDVIEALELLRQIEGV